MIGNRVMKDSSAPIQSGVSSALTALRETVDDSCKLAGTLQCHLGIAGPESAQAGDREVMDTSPVALIRMMTKQLREANQAISESVDHLTN